MDEGTFIVIALAISLALLASLCFGIDRLGDRVLTLALVVSEHRRQIGWVVIEIALEGTRR